MSKTEMKELPKIWSPEEIKKDQDQIKASLSALDNQVHHNAVQCLIHAEKHGDTSLMVRLLTDIIDEDKTGYRRQGLIAWMKHFSPMRLSGKTINLSGTVETKDGNIVRQTFDTKGAWNNPFWTMFKEQGEVLKPFYQQSFLSQVERAIKAMEEAISNTQDGKPINPEKPFFKGKHADTILNFAVEVKKLKAIIPSDSTMEEDRAKRKAMEQAALNDLGKAKAA